MTHRRYARTGVAWLELLLVLAVLALLLQVFPSLIVDLRSVLDLRNWTVWSWFSAFCVLFALLCVIRYVPEIADGFKEQGQRNAFKRSRRKSQDDVAAKLRQMDQERELYRRMMEARKRQVL
jgi:hypothetical protein